MGYMKTCCFTSNLLRQVLADKKRRKEECKANIDQWNIKPQFYEVDQINDEETVDQSIFPPRFSDFVRLEDQKEESSD
jgi:hypothetical protein